MILNYSAIAATRDFSYCFCGILANLASQPRGLKN